LPVINKLLLIASVPVRARHKTLCAEHKRQQENGLTCTGKPAHTDRPASKAKAAIPASVFVAIRNNGSEVWLCLTRSQEVALQWPLWLDLRISSVLFSTQRYIFA
jgi:hypothetical protein